MGAAPGLLGSTCPSGKWVEGSDWRCSCFCSPACPDARVRSPVHTRSQVHTLRHTDVHTTETHCTDTRTTPSDAICVCAPHVHMGNKHTCQMASHRHVRAERTHVQCRYTKGPSETFTLTGGTPLAAAPKVPPSACGPVGARPPPETWPRAVALTPLTHSLCSLDSVTSKMR